MPPPPAAATAAAASFPAMLHPVQGLVDFGDILADFLHQWNSVLLDAASIAAAFPAATVPVPESDPKPSPVREPETNRASEPEPSRHSDPESKPEPKPSLEHDREREGGDQSEAVLGLICERMGSRALRRFVTAHLRDRSWLRRVGPGALRRAPDPAALVLRAVGRYYIYAESGDAEAACVLLLELYVRAGCPQLAGQGELQAEAREAALSWRSRLVGEKGRVADAGARDARGLILLMAAFGVPVEFPALELYELYHAGGGLACAEVLKCSQLFVKKMRDVVADMLNKGIYHEAIGIILAFELQDGFPLAAILTYMIEKFVHNRKDQEREGQYNLAASKGHDEEELVLFRSISKYLEDHKLCSSEISCVSIAKRIALLEECVGKPKQAFKGIKRKRAAEEDSLECTVGPKCPYASAASNASPNKNHLG